MYDTLLWTRLNVVLAPSPINPSQLRLQWPSAQILLNHNRIWAPIGKFTCSTSGFWIWLCCMDSSRKVPITEGGESGGTRSVSADETQSSWDDKASQGKDEGPQRRQCSTVDASWLAVSKKHQKTYVTTIPLKSSQIKRFLYRWYEEMARFQQVNICVFRCIFPKPVAVHWESGQQDAQHIVWNQIHKLDSLILEQIFCGLLAARASLRKQIMLWPDKPHSLGIYYAI